MVGQLVIPVHSHQKYSKLSCNKQGWRPVLCSAYVGSTLAWPCFVCAMQLLAYSPLIVKRTWKNCWLLMPNRQNHQRSLGVYKMPSPRWPLLRPTTVTLHLPPLNLTPHPPTPHPPTPHPPTQHLKVVATRKGGMILKRPCSTLTL